MDQNIIKELKSEARADAITNFFVRHKKLFTRLLITGVVLLIAYFIFSIIQKSAEEKYSKIFHQALIEEEIGNFDKSQENLKSIYEAKFAPSGVKALASMRYADLLLMTNKETEALKIYQEVAFSSRYDNFVQELSGLMAAKIITAKTSKNDDEETKKKALSDVKEIVDNGKILKDYVLEQYATLLVKTDKKAEARKALEEISKSEKASQSLKLRARDLMNLTN